MRKTLVWMMTAALLLAGCGSSTAPASGSAQPQEETREAVEETVEETAEAPAETPEAAEAPAETEAAAETEATAEEEPAVDESELLPQAKVDEVLEEAEVMGKRLGAFTSSSGQAEADEYSTGSLVEYVSDIYTFSIPSNWKAEDDHIEIESRFDSAAMIWFMSEDLSIYGTITDEQVEAFLQTYEEMSEEDFAELFGLENIDISDFERIDILGDQQAAAASFEGTRDGMDVEGILVVGVDKVNSRMFVSDEVQTLNCVNSHFNDFKTFLGTMTY